MTALIVVIYNLYINHPKWAAGIIGTLSLGNIVASMINATVNNTRRKDN